VDDFWYAGDPALRIGTDERERAASALSEHFAAGRLSQDELEERLDRAYAARTGADLLALFRDLPSRTPLPARVPPRDQAGPTRRPAAGAALLVAVVVIAGLWVATVRVPPFFLIPLVWFALARGRRGRHGPWGAPRRW
jgi:hypothetical protein